MKKSRSKGRSERTSGSVYTSRPGLGKDTEQRMAQLGGNYYGKKPAPRPDVSSAGQLPGFPRRTQIHTR